MGAGGGHGESRGMWFPRGFARAWMVLAALGMGGLTGCDQRDEGFECGLARGDGRVRACGGLTEVCVCETHSCAAYDADCDTELRYLDAPFARSSIAGQCVPPRAARTRASGDDGSCAPGDVMPDAADGLDAARSDAGPMMEEEE